MSFILDVSWGCDQWALAILSAALVSTSQGSASPLRERRLAMDRHVRSTACALLIPFLGCSIAPKSFRDVESAAPLVRARAVGLGEGLPDSAAIPALLDRLTDPDPVVRLSAHEALKRRTGQDFGYTPWGEINDRAAAVTRWRQWWANKQATAPPVAKRRSADGPGSRLAGPGRAP